MQTEGNSPAEVLANPVSDALTQEMQHWEVVAELPKGGLMIRLVDPIDK